MSFTSIIIFASSLCLDPTHEGVVWVEEVVIFASSLCLGPTHEVAWVEEVVIFAGPHFNGRGGLLEWKTISGFGTKNGILPKVCWPRYCVAVRCAFTDCDVSVVYSWSFTRQSLSLNCSAFSRTSLLSKSVPSSCNCSRCRCISWAYLYSGGPCDCKSTGPKCSLKKNNAYTQDLSQTKTENKMSSLASARLAASAVLVAVSLDKNTCGLTKPQTALASKRARCDAMVGKGHSRQCKNLQWDR
jgi:hypothetical protein